MPTSNELVKNISKPSKRTQWKRLYAEQRHTSHMLLREVDALNRQLAEVPARVRVLCRIVCRMLRGK